ncbi:MAG: 1-deoxy-D-xylulose-5-phosphate reductoisomerase [Spirochaetes bacterium]|nr:1-deoxy-D-xylulose-5-phosphate reductoisomerase [Spirochaetota bacterium]
MSSKIIILGSTGSIGTSALRVLRFLKNDFEVYGLTCYGNLELFEEQLNEFRPSLAAVASNDLIDKDEYKKITNKFPEIKFFEGNEGVVELVRNKADVLISSIVGAAGLLPTLESLPFIKRLALANKETLVMAGDIVKKKVNEFDVELIPVDSEHSAIFSLIQNADKGSIKKIILTASGGSLRDRTLEEMASITPEDALAHPTWDMGNKITIDSATMMNKGLEVIEAHHLFDIDYGSIDVIVHPESIIHSMVEMNDGAIHAYLSIADMALPIINALTFPDSKANPFETLDLTKVGKLEFLAYDNIRFPALELCYNAGRIGGTMPAVLNAANEIAVHAFLGKKIAFTDIVKIVEKTINDHKVIDNPDLSDIFAADEWARDVSMSFIDI